MNAMYDLKGQYTQSSWGFFLV